LDRERVGSLPQLEIEEKMNGYSLKRYNDNLLKRYYKITLVTIGLGFERFRVNVEDQNYRKKCWDMQPKYLEQYKNEMLERGLLQKNAKSMYIVCSLSPHKGTVFARFQCELCGRVEYRNIPYNHDSDYRIECNCENKKMD
jgi:hypothetical protein